VPGRFGRNARYFNLHHEHRLPVRGFTRLCEGYVVVHAAVESRDLTFVGDLQRGSPPAGEMSLHYPYGFQLRWFAGPCKRPPDTLWARPFFRRITPRPPTPRGAFNPQVALERSMRPCAPCPDATKSCRNLWRSLLLKVCREDAADGQPVN
jgi:hypothetical protein